MNIIREYFCLKFMLWAMRCAPKNWRGDVVLDNVHHVIQQLRYELEREQLIKKRSR